MRGSGGREARGPGAPVLYLSANCHSCLCDDGYSLWPSHGVLGLLKTKTCVCNRVMRFE